ncbi:MAG: hypothetical protein P8Y69_14740 [Gammaproteobacteria bacterium]
MRNDRFRRRLGALAATWMMLSPASAMSEVVLSTSVARVGGQTSSDPAQGVYPGDVLRYTITISNEGTLAARAGSVVVTNPLPEGTEYVDGSASGAGTVVTFSVDGETFAPSGGLLVGQAGSGRAATAADYRSIRWTYQRQLAAGASAEVSFDLRIR